MLQNLPQYHITIINENIAPIKSFFVVILLNDNFLIIIMQVGVANIYIGWEKTIYLSVWNENCVCKMQGFASIDLSLHTLDSWQWWCTEIVTVSLKIQRRKCTTSGLSLFSKRCILKGRTIFVNSYNAIS